MMVKKNDLAELEAKNAELLTDLQRTRADFENYRKQTEASLARAIEGSAEKTVGKILPVIDDLQRAISSMPELAPVEKTLEKSMKELELEKIRIDIEFDPELHEAVSVSGEGEKQEMTELRAGYKYNGKVIRPAMVSIEYK